MGYSQATSRPSIANGCVLKGGIAARSMQPIYGDTHVVSASKSPMPVMPAVQRIPDWQSVHKSEVIMSAGSQINVNTSALDASVAALNTVRNNLSNNVNTMTLDIDRFEGDLDNMEQLIG